MGIVSIIAVAAGIGFLFALRRKLHEVADEEKDEHLAWGLRWSAAGAALMALLGVVGIVDSYIYKLPNPLEPEGIELPEKSEPTSPAQKVEIKPASKPDPMKEAQEEHEQALDEFEKKASP